MKFYLVENGNYIYGYYRNIENAEMAVKANDALIEELRHRPNVDNKPCFITEIETED